MKVSRILLVSALCSMILLVITGCGGMKGQGGKITTKLYETFYFGEEGTQYYIRPFTIKGESKEKIILDMTFRYKDDIKDTALVNMSIKSTELIKSLDLVTIDNTALKVDVTDIDLMYNEVESRGYLSRFSLQVPLADLRPLFRNEQWTVSFTTPSGSKTFLTSKKSEKTIFQLERGLFVLTN